MIDITKKNAKIRKKELYKETEIEVVGKQQLLNNIGELKWTLMSIWQNEDGTYSYENDIIDFISPNLPKANAFELLFRGLTTLGVNLV